MDIQMLDEIRLLKDSDLNVSSICHLLSKFLQSNVVVSDCSGKILGLGVFDDDHMVQEIPHGLGATIDPVLYARFLSILSTKENLDLHMLGIDLDTHATLCPLEIDQKPLGVLFVYRGQACYDIQDVVLTEYAGMLLSMQIHHKQVHEKLVRDTYIEDLDRCFAVLTYNELLFVLQMPDILPDAFALMGQPGDQVRVILNDLSRDSEICRSSVVNCLKKLVSSGLIESRSGGMRGTYIKILNPYFLEYIQDVIKQRISDGEYVPGSH